MLHKLTILPYLIKHTPPNAFSSSSTVNDSLRVYAFDLDHTIIRPRVPGSRFSRSADDWEFMTYASGKTTLDKLISIVETDLTAHVVIFSNQGAVITIPPSSKSCIKYTEKISLILTAIAKKKNGNLLIERLWIYSSPKKPAAFGRKLLKKTSNSMKIIKPSNGMSKSIPTIDEASVISPEIFTKMRKPETGMMDEFKKDLKKAYPAVKDIDICHFCGDAAGRSGDFSDSDIKFAEKLNVPFKIPEDVF